ncbi:MAG: hypothetical protein ABWY29_07020 [Blastococcus sp.]
MTELPFWQPLPHGTVAWYDRFNRRDRIEGIFGNVENDASQNITRGRFRVGLKGSRTPDLRGRLPD